MKSALLCIALSTVPFVSHADTFYTNSYTIDLTGIASPVTNILMQEVPGTCCGQRMNYLDPNSGIAAASQVTTINDPFLLDSATTVAFGIGIVQDLPGDASGQQHLVMFMNSDATALATGLDWSALFPTVDEDQTIANLQLATSGGLNWGNSFDILAPGLDSSIDFMNSLASPNGLLGPGGVYTSPYFDVPAPGTPASDFEVVAFSTGQVIGTGSVVQSAINTSPVPEPSSFFLFGSLVLVGGVWRSRVRQGR
jgi:PEP-CTERM motif